MAESRQPQRKSKLLEPQPLPLLSDDDRSTKARASLTGCSTTCGAQRETFPRVALLLRLMVLHCLWRWAEVAPSKLPQQWQSVGGD
jgi:hypothetical protein